MSRERLNLENAAPANVCISSPCQAMRRPAVRSAAGGADGREHSGVRNKLKGVKEEAADLVALSLHGLEVFGRQCVLRSKTSLSVTVSAKCVACLCLRGLMFYF